MYLSFVLQCVKSGITAVQLREKVLKTDELLEFATQLKDVLSPFNIPLIINDNLDLCLEVDADGVHLGQGDGDIKRARDVLGPHKIIGQTVNNMKEVEIANSLPINYIGVGAIFPTKNKPNIQTVWGIPGLKGVCSISKHPVIAIGGINEENAYSIIKSGATGIAAISVFHDSEDLDSTIKDLHKNFNLGQI
jgi:thiamine-phosphate pyrophosphorylase